MFGRGQWAIFGVEPTSIEAFRKSLSDPLTLFNSSQLTASIVSKFQNQETSGINPFGNPRLDDKLTDAGTIAEIGDLLTSRAEDSEGGLTGEDISLIEENLQYIGTESDFSLGNNKFGFWFVINYPKDVSDPNTKKEQIAYEDIERPFKFLNKEEKKGVEERVKATSILSRSQFPVLVDFQHGRVYVASVNKDEVIAVGDLLTKLGAKTFPLVWDFGSSNWPSQFLNTIAQENRFTSEMKERADQLAQLPPDLIEKLEDKQLEKIVSSYFSLAKLENEVWVGLTTPSKIRIHKPIDAVGVSNPSVAFSLLNMSNDAQVATAGVVFQEVVIRQTKTGERVSRNDLFTIDVNDNVNLQDAGAALLRGFDIPQFKRYVKTAIKAKGRMEVKDFWYMWIDSMHTSVLEFVNNVTDALNIDKKCGLVVPDYTAQDEVEVEVGDGK